MNFKVAADLADLRHSHNSFLTSSSRSPHDVFVVVFNAWPVWLNLRWLTLSYIHSLNCIYRCMTARCSQRFVLTLYLPVTPTPVWGFSFLSVTIINVSALTGVFFVPLMKSRFGKYALTYFIALAIGTLFSTAILQLLPEVWHRDIHACIHADLWLSYTDTKITLSSLHGIAIKN